MLSILDWDIFSEIPQRIKLMRSGPAGPPKEGCSRMHSRNRSGPTILRSVGMLALVLMVGLVAVQGAWAMKPHTREGVIFGVAFGTSEGQVNLFPGTDIEVSSDWEQGVSPEYRLGYAVIKNRLLLTVANQQWLYEQGVLAEDKLRINTQNWSFDLTFCPGKPTSWWGGLFVKAGIGYANSRLTILEPIEEDDYGNTFEEVFKRDEIGTSYTVGIGYEFRLANSLAAGIGASYIHQPIDGEIFADSTFIPTNLTLNWYW